MRQRGEQRSRASRWPAFAAIAARLAATALVALTGVVLAYPEALSSVLPPNPQAPRLSRSELLCRELGSEDHEEALAASEALADLGAEALPALETVLNGVRVRPKLLALRAIARMGDDGAPCTKTLAAALDPWAWVCPAHQPKGLEGHGLTTDRAWNCTLIECEARVATLVAQGKPGLAEILKQESAGWSPRWPEIIGKAIGPDNAGMETALWELDMARERRSDNAVLTLEFLRQGRGPARERAGGEDPEEEVARRLLMAAYYGRRWAASALEQPGMGASADNAALTYSSIARVGDSYEALSFLARAYLGGDRPAHRAFREAAFGDRGAALLYLRAAIQESDPHMRRLAALGLSGLQPEGADWVALVAAALDDENPEVRFAGAICAAWNAPRNGALAGRLEALLADGDADVRSAAGVALACLGRRGEFDLPKYVALANQWEWRRRFSLPDLRSENAELLSHAAFCALAESGDAGRRVLLDLYGAQTEVGSLAPAVALARMGREGVAAALEFEASRNPSWTRRETTELGSRYWSSDAVRSVVWVVRDHKDLTVRSLAARALLELPSLSPDIAAVALPALRALDSDLETAVVPLLPRHGQPSQARNSDGLSLREAVFSEREEVAEVLASCGDLRGRAFVWALRDAPSRGPESALPRPRPAPRTPFDDDVRGPVAVIEALIEEFDVETQGLAPELVALSSDRDDRVADAAVTALARLGEPRGTVVPPLLTALCRGGEYRAGPAAAACALRSLGRDAIPEVERVLPALPEGDARAAVAALVADLPPDPAVGPELERLAGQPGSGLWSRIAAELVRSDEASTGFLRVCVSDPRGGLRQEAAAALARRGRVGARELAGALHTGDKDTRLAAATGLGRMHLQDAQPAVPALRKALTDPDPDVSRAARAALAQLGVPTSASPGNTLTDWLRRVFGKLFP